MAKNREYEDIFFEWSPEKTIAFEKTKKVKRRYKIISILLVIYMLVSMFYITIIFETFPSVTELRDIYIETAMTTGEHQWLATAFFPTPIINSVMGTLGGRDITVSSTDITISDKQDILNQQSLKVGDTDYAGYEVLTNDIEQGIVISKIIGSGFVGKIVMIDDPSRVFIGATKTPGVKGEFICDYLEDYDAIVGINASGFLDTDGHGTGGIIVSKCLTRGESFGSYAQGVITHGFTTDNKLLVGNLSEADWSSYDLRDCCQFSPAIIIDGKAVVSGSDGWGIHPRTIVGQRSDGVVFFLIIDGRQPGYSIGATVGDCAEILLKYGAINAAACDGGSSSVLAYNGELINTPSTPMKSSGRYLPNAWLVAKK